MQISLLCRENIYYQESAESVPKLIASSPDETTVMNGIPDWLYEEEILSKESAVWFSPEGTRLLYASFNDSGVDITNYPLYGNYEDNLNTSPELMAVRYPKVSFLLSLFLYHFLINFSLWFKLLTFVQNVFDVISKSIPPGFVCLTNVSRIC